MTQVVINSTMPSLTVKPVKTLPRNTVSAHDEALLLLERCLPESISKLWLASKGIEDLFQKGGLDIPKRFVSKALKSNQNNDRHWAKNHFNKTFHYCFAGEHAMTFAAPRDQRDFLTKAATSDKEKERICPSIPDGYFLDFQLNHLDKFL